MHGDWLRLIARHHEGRNALLEVGIVDRGNPVFECVVETLKSQISLGGALVEFRRPGPQRPPSRVRIDFSSSHAAMTLSPIDPERPSPCNAIRKMVWTVSAWNV